MIIHTGATYTWTINIKLFQSLKTNNRNDLTNKNDILVHSWIFQQPLIYASLFNYIKNSTSEFRRYLETQNDCREHELWKTVKCYNGDLYNEISTFCKPHHL